MLLLTLIFAVVHSGLASLRDSGEKVMGERAYRVLFAGTSLPLAVSTVVSFLLYRWTVHKSSASLSFNFMLVHCIKFHFSCLHNMFHRLMGVLFIESTLTFRDLGLLHQS